MLKKLSKLKIKKIDKWDIIRNGIMGVLLVVVSVASYQLTNDYLEYKEGNDAYDAIANMMYEVPVYTEDGVVYAGDSSADGTQIKGNSDPVFVWSQEKFESMLEYNADVKGWIRLKGEKNSQDEISYPVVQGQDNEYYLHYLVNKTWNANGSIFVDYRVKSLKSSKNSIIYGHNMNNGSMFGKLKNFLDEEYYKKHKYFDVYIEEKHYRYYIFSIFKTPTVGSEVLMVDFTKDWAEQEAEKYSTEETTKKKKKTTTEATTEETTQDTTQETTTKKKSKKNKDTTEETTKKTSKKNKKNKETTTQETTTEETTTLSPEEIESSKKAEKKKKKKEENDRFVDWCNRMQAQSYIKIEKPYKGFEGFTKDSKIITLITCTPTDSSKKMIVQLVRGEEIVTDEKGKETIVETTKKKSSKKKASADEEETTKAEQ